MIEASGLWLKKTGEGKPYFAGKMGGVNILIFKNEKKTSPNQPDYRLFFAEPKRQEKKSQEPDFNSNEEIPF